MGTSLLIWGRGCCGKKGAALQQILWGGCAAAVTLAGLASWADRRRANRSDLDAVGFVPWPLVLILSILAAAVLGAVALKTH
jgi:hypothetical protein